MVVAENLKVTGALNPDTRIVATATGHDRRTALSRSPRSLRRTPWCVLVPGVSRGSDRIGAAIARHAVTDLWTSFADLRRSTRSCWSRCGIGRSSASPVPGLSGP